MIKSINQSHHLLCLHPLDPAQCLHRSRVAGCHRFSTYTVLSSLGCWSCMCTVVVDTTLHSCMTEVPKRLLMQLACPSSRSATPHLLVNQVFNPDCVVRDSQGETRDSFSILPIGNWLGECVFGGHLHMVAAGGDQSALFCTEEVIAKLIHTLYVGSRCIHLSFYCFIQFVTHSPFASKIFEHTLYILVSL